MERCVVALFLLLGLNPLHSQQSPNDQQIASQISQTAEEFQLQTQRFARGWTYPASDLNSALALTRQQLLNDLPPDAAPLRAYVLKRFPTSIPGVPSNQLVDMRICGQYLDNANDLLSSLKNVNAYRLDLVVDSNPAGALFELKPEDGETVKGASRGTLTNIWRGVYTYTVKKEGEKTITGTVNLIREKGNILKCAFVESGSTDQATPCEMMSTQ